MSDLAYKYALAEELAGVMKQKFLEKEPRPSWRETPFSLAEYEAWLRREVEELLAAPPLEVMREAADVANLAAIYADVKRRGGQVSRERDKPGFASRLEQAARAVLDEIQLLHLNCPLCQHDRGTGHRRGCPIAELERLTA